MFQVKMMMLKKLSDLFTLDYILSVQSTIFEYLQDNDNFPLVNAFINNDNYQDITEEYFIGYSADKYISPLMEKLYSKNDDLDVLSSKLAKFIYRRFATKWKKIYDALMTQYNPLENYSMLEERTPELTTEETENVNTEVTTNRETNASSKYKGFNASDPVTITTTDGSEDVTTSGASADNETRKVIENTGKETLTRSGNIGVTTSQQMLESEFKVRQYDFYKMIYNDIDSVLCLSIY